MNNNTLQCNVKIGNDHYYANPQDKYVIQERTELAITALVVGIVSLLYVLRKATEERSIFLLIPFSSGLLCVVFGSIQLKKYMDAVNNVKEYGRNCRP